METVELSCDVYEPDGTNSEISPIVLMHGFLWNKFVFRNIARDLCNETKRKVYSLDLRNHGESPSREECSFFLMAEDVKRFLDENSLKKVVFVTHSFSSSIAYLIALERPDSVEKMVMIDNPPFNDFNDHFSRESVFPQLEIQNKLLKTLDPKMKLKVAKAKFLNLATFGTKSQECFYKKAAYDLTKENGKFKWKIDMEYLMDLYRQGMFNLKGRGSSDHEILIIRCPNSGRVYDSKFEAVLKHNPKARLVTIEGTTHLLMFEKTREFLDIVKDFLCAP
ncbi:hypothetical protein JTE90_011848 [Oedothorax gibbosus]|uniref:sn-1-specific diacylglycerol lipase ABHD11 n=2 Tax=Oedothorax gibbosus TaxID=931172 RepID=A0AAV6U348_9ARAC|nr:hypothetical protein JTE90_011848 [Oedothorax gibbosus]